MSLLTDALVTSVTSNEDEVGELPSLEEKISFTKLNNELSLLQHDTVISAESSEAKLIGGLYGITPQEVETITSMDTLSKEVIIKDGLNISSEMLGNILVGIYTHIKNIVNNKDDKVTPIKKELDKVYDKNSCDLALYKSLSDLITKLPHKEIILTPNDFGVIIDDYITLLSNYSNYDLKCLEVVKHTLDYLYKIKKEFAGYNMNYLNYPKYFIGKSFIEKIRSIKESIDDVKDYNDFTSIDFSGLYRVFDTIKITNSNYEYIDADDVKVKGFTLNDIDDVLVNIEKYFPKPPKKVVDSWDNNDRRNFIIKYNKYVTDLQAIADDLSYFRKEIFLPIAEFKYILNNK